MPLSPELRARMGRDMQSNRKFDGDTDIPAECRAFADLAEMETVERPAVDGWPYKIYIFRAKNRTGNCPVHINVHGGGFLIGHMVNDSLWSAWLADRIQGIVVDVDYTTTEFAPYPVCLDQTRDAARFTWANCKAWGGDGKRISMGGYSAGATLTIACGMAAKETGECPYCLLIDGYGPSDMRYDDRVAREVKEYWKMQEHRSVGFGVLLGDGDASVLSDPCLYHLGAPDEMFLGFPPTLILAAANCPFRFQNEQLGVKLAAVGVEVTMKRFADAGHGFIPHFMPHWQEAGDLIVRAIKGASL